MTESLRVLFIEDSQDDAKQVALELRRGGYDPEFERVQAREDMKAEDKTSEQINRDPKAPRRRAVVQEKKKMKRIIDVYTGKVEAGGKDTILRSNAIASCVVIAAYEPTKKVGALAHVMVPGAAPGGKTWGGTSRRTRYAADAIEEMMWKCAWSAGGTCLREKMIRFAGRTSPRLLRFSMKNA